MTDDPYPNTPRHTVLLHMAVGRPPGGQRRDPGRGTHDRGAPAAAGGRSGSQQRRQPFYGIEPITKYPYGGSALVVWDIGPLRAGDTLGTPLPPITNTAPRLGKDPHGLTGREVAAQLQFSRFIDGAFVDVCGRAPCHAAGWTGP